MKRSRSDILLALAVGLAALLVYRLTLAPTVLPADSGEFQFAAPLLGLAHPTGYPLYLLLGKAWTVLAPLGDVASRMNLLSAVLSAAAVGMLYLLGKRLGLGLVPSLLAALTLAFSYTFWSQATRAEVYALNSLFTIVLLYLAAGAEDEQGEQEGTPGEQGKRRYWLPLLFTLGLSLTHHRMAMLLIPALALLALVRQQRVRSREQRVGIRGQGVGSREQGAGSREQGVGSREQGVGSREQGEQRSHFARHVPHPASRIPHPASRILHPASRILHPASALPYLVAFLLPLLLYLYIPLRGAATPYMRLAVGGGPDLLLYPSSPGDVIALIMGSVFRGSLAVPDSLHTAARLSMMLDLLRQQIGVGGIALALIGLLALLRRAPRLAVALALAYLALAGFCFIYFIGDVADLFTPSYIIVIILLGAGVAFLGDVAGRIARRPGRALLLVLAALLPLAFLAGNYKALDASEQTATRSAWETILLLPLPQRAILVSNDRDEMTPMWYLQYVEKQRRDLVGLFPQIKPGEVATLGALLDWLLARGQQPYLIKPMPGLEIKYRLEQADGLPRVTGLALASTTPQGKPVGMSFAGVAELSSAAVPASVAPGGALAVTLFWRPLAPMRENYHVFVQLVSASGERVAGSDHRPGDVFYPHVAVAGWRRSG